MGLLRSELVPGGAGGSIEVGKGEILRVIDVEGRQIADLIALNAHDITERISTAETVNFAGWTIRLGVGSVLYSSKPRPMFTVIEDTSSGQHDLLYAACSEEFYRSFGGLTGHRNCHDNLVEALRRYGMPPADLPNPVNLFQHTAPRADGTIVEGLPGAEAGQYVALRAEFDVVVGVSSCPWVEEVGIVADIGGADKVDAALTAKAPTPIRLEVSRA